jgi:hypothetical protein
LFSSSAPVLGQDDIPAGHGRPGVGCAALPGEPVQVNADALVGASDPQAKPGPFQASVHRDQSNFDA